jgi:hypothetical protein
MFGPLSTHRYTANGVDFDMVRLPPGRFTIPVEDGRVQQVFLSYPFEIGAFQVSASLWGAVVFSLQHQEDDEIRSSTFSMLDAFCTQLSSLGIGFFRLPTVAELAWSAHCGVAAAYGSSDRVIDIGKFSAKQGSSKIDVGASGVFDHNGFMADTSADRADDRDPDELPLFLLDPARPPSFVGQSRDSRGGRRATYRRQDQRLQSIMNHYHRTGALVGNGSIHAAFRVVRVPLDLKLEVS